MIYFLLLTFQLIFLCNSFVLLLFGVMRKGMMSKVGQNSKKRGEQTQEARQ